ncbi:MAG TPA: hypothetical protein VK661_09365 [Planctomycetota bacterium]|nr:hypothetical protein [Planctomycetota bacterium]
MLLSKENLNLAKIASTEPSRLALTGVYVDPKRKVTAASNGAILVEISAPKETEAPFPTGGMELAGEDQEPFVLPAKAALEAAKAAKWGAALASSPSGKPAILAASDEKKSVSTEVEPVEGTFPEYRNDGIFGKGDSIALAFKTDNLNKILGAAAIGDVVKLILFKDRMRIESTNERGQNARGVLMCFGKPAANRSQAQPERAPEEETPSPRAASNPSGRHYYGRWKKRKVDPSAPPTAGQIAFYAYLLFRRDQKVTQAALAGDEIVGKIEDLKKNLPVDKGRCTWPQWRKLFMILQEQGGTKTLCEVLNGLTTIAETSATIDEWVKKEAPEPVEAAA